MERTPEQASEAAPPAEARCEGDRLEALFDGVEVPPPVPEVREAYGTVESASDVIVVRAGDRRVEARRAVSCLVEPRAGDLVLVALSDRSFVLAVLAHGGERAPGVTLSVEGDVTLQARGGKLALVAGETVTLASGTKVEITAPDLEVRAMKTSFFSASLSYVGRTLDSEIDRLKIAARTVDRTIERVSERIKRSFRTIEEIERVKVQELDVDVEGNVSIHADNTIMSSDKLVKIDGEQIHLG